MFRVIFMALIAAPKKSSQHFERDKPACLDSYTCTHSGVEVCGIDTVTSEKMWFLDQCDMYEYNCDNDLAYEKTNFNDCSDLPKDYTTISPANDQEGCTRSRHNCLTTPEITTTDVPTTIALDDIDDDSEMKTIVICPSKVKWRRFNESTIIAECPLRPRIINTTIA